MRVRELINDALWPLEYLKKIPSLGRDFEVYG